MEPEGSLPHLQETATCFYPEPDQSSPFPSPPSPSHCLKIHFSIILPSTPKCSKWCVSLISPHQNPDCTCPVSTRTTCLAHSILLHFVTRMIIDEVYLFQSSSLCSLLHPLVTSSLLGPNILLSTLFSKALSLRTSV